MGKTPEAADETGSEPEAKVIKRYTNRKLYDTVESRYVTLEEIAGMIRAGEEVQIVDNRTKEDLTSVTLAQIIFEQEKKHQAENKKAAMPLGVLKDIVRNGGDQLQAFINSEIQPRVSTIREGAEKLPKMFRRKGGEEGTPETPPEASEETVEPPKTEKEVRARMNESLDELRSSVEQWQQWLDERVQSTVHSVRLPDLQQEISGVKSRLEELRSRLAKATGDSGKPEADAADDDGSTEK